ncbi:uncharacterized protein UDID_17599 [Ustilago sp. UG-2017a]|nr:uncharacterized protein UDID_17599 [Ustilago sp. UG-2017a]
MNPPQLTQPLAAAASSCSCFYTIFIKAGVQHQSADPDSHARRFTIMRKISTQRRRDIIEKLQNGLSHRQIAKELERELNRKTIRTVRQACQAFIERFNTTASRTTMRKELTKIEAALASGFSSKLVRPTVKYGNGCIMLWGRMPWAGVGRMAVVEGNMNRFHTSIFSRTISFQQCRRSKLSWSSQSPDLNLIEHLCGMLKKQPGQYPTMPKDIPELGHRSAAEWNKISAAERQTLIESMPRRIQAGLKAKGDHTKY